jgi:hypothetical protein
MPLSASERRLRARKASLTAWQNTVDRSARGRHANAGLMAKFAREIDPDGTMDPKERAAKVKTRHAKHIADMQWAAVQARRAKAEKRRQDAEDMRAKRGRAS